MRNTSICIAFAVALIPALSQAINCKLAASPQEKLVCSDNSLKELDRRLNENYNAITKKGNALGSATCAQEDHYCCPESDRTKELQRDWAQQTLREKSGPASVSALKEAYEDRITHFELALGKSTVATTERPADKSDKKSPVRFVWVQKKVGQRLLLEFPKMVDSAFAKNVERVNKSIQEKADKLVTDLKLCASVSRGGVFDVFAYEITIAAENLFGIKIYDRTGGCLGGCAHPAEELTDVVFWDLETGEVITDALENPVTLAEANEKAFYKVAYAENKGHLNPKEQGCPDVTYDDVSKMALKGFALHHDYLSYDVNPYAHHGGAACGVELKVTLAKTKQWLAVNPKLVKLLARLKAAGHVSASFADEIRNAVSR